jgi:dTMP kinase
MPLFISFEGPDGSGKSTQARLLALALRERGLCVTETREPGGTPLGERVRTLLLDPDSPPATPLVMALLLSASRAQLAETVIRPALASGHAVIVDRYADSTTAYQGFGLGLDIDAIRALRRVATGGTEPDVVVYVDIASEVGLSRVHARGNRNRLDSETLAFHTRVRNGYCQIMADNPGRWIKVNGDAPAKNIHEEILTNILPRLER